MDTAEQPGAAPLDPFDPEFAYEADELRALRTALELAEGFKLLLVRSSSRMRSREVASWLAEHGQPVDVVELFAPIARVDDLRVSLSDVNPDRPVLVIGLDASIPGDPRAPLTSPLLVDLNAARDVLVEQLATAVARDAAIRARFADGVYWLTVGRNPQLITVHADLAAELGIETVFRSPIDGKQKLTAALAGKRVLLVLDDVWDAAHAEALEVVDTSERAGRILITTRNLDVLTWRGAEPLPLDIMTEEQARALLATWTGARAESLPAEASDVAEACGRLPLALAIAGSLVRKPGGSWARVLRLLQSARLDKLRGRIPAYPYRNVYQAIAASVSQLVADNVAERAEQCYAELAVFAEDEDIPASALRVLWGRHGLDADDGLDLASVLASYSLASVSEGGGLRLHDIQRAYVRACHGDIAALHGEFVDAYAEICQAGDQARGPAEAPIGAGARDYFYARLPYHLLQAARADELRQLLGRYAWLDGKLRTHGPAELLADYELLADLDSQNRGLALIRDALRLSSHVLADDAAQLPGQLIGRLGLLADEFDVIVSLLVQAHIPNQPWICPLVANLTPPGGPLLRTFVGHSDSVTAVTLSEDGERALSGSRDSTLKLWDTKSGALIHTFASHSASVIAVALSEDGKRALSGSRDSTLKLWDTESGALIYTFAGHSASVIAVALSEDGERALSGSLDCTLKLWDTESGDLIQTCSSNSVTAVALSPDVKRALSSSADFTLKLWDTASGVLIHTFAGHSNWVIAVALSRDGERALSASDDRTLKLWDTESGALIQTCSDHLSSTTAVALNRDGERAISGSRDSTLKLWDTERGELIHTFAGHSDLVNAVALSADGNRALSGSDDRTLKMWDTESGTLISNGLGHPDAVYAVALSKDGKRTLSGSRDHTLKMWDTESGTLIRTFHGHSDSVSAVTLSGDGKRALSGSRDHTLKLWNIESGALIQTFRGHSSWVLAVALSGDGKRALSGSRDHTLKLWDTAGGVLIQSLQGHSSWVNAVALSEDGKRALSGSGDGTLKLWDTAGGVLIRSFQGHSSSVNAVAFSEDGKRALSGSDDMTLKLWATDRSESLIQTFCGHSSWVNAVALSKDGKRAISGSGDRKLKLWDTETGRVITGFSTEAAIRECSLSTSIPLRMAAGDQSGRVYFLQFIMPARPDSG